MNPSKFDPSKYIGIPHYYGRSDFLACDCAGLCKLVYNTEGLRESMDDHRPFGDPSETKTQRLRMLRYLLKNMDKVKDYNELRELDIVVFRISGDLHIGVYVGYGKVLAMAVPVVYGYSKSTIYRRQYIEQFFVCGFRSRKEGS